MRFAIIAASLALLTGCASFHNPSDPARLNVDQVPKSSGIAIISAGAPENCVSTATHLDVIPAYPGYKGIGIASMDVDGYVMKSDFADHQGNVHAFVLPVGDYRLSPWIANPYVSAKRVPRIEFSISAGEVVYLGEFFMPVHCVLNPVYSIRDQRDRDMAIVMQRNPKLAGANIATRLPQFAANSSDDKK